MAKLYLIILLLLGNVGYCQNWMLIKDTVSPLIAIPAEFDSIYPQPLATLGWEDGIHISGDGLHLYCTYLPIDFLSFVLNGGLPNNFSSTYLRGAPDFGMDLISNIIGATEWLHSDILYAHRAAVTDTFSTWTLSGMERSFYSEGAPAPVFTINKDSIEFMLFTSNDNTTNHSDIWMIHNTSANPSGIGSPMPFPVNTPQNEDNPHLVRLDNSNLVLMFDSDNLPGGLGNNDIWFAGSSDNGLTWSVPANVSSINTSNKEHQPFLYQDLNTNKWWLYYAAMHTDGKLAIFRAEQGQPNNWNSWGTPELVIGAGNAAGIGEPTLTENGDISFVVVYVDPNNNSIYNHFDSDPWFLRKTSSGMTGLEAEKAAATIYPNPVSRTFRVKFNDFNMHSVSLYDRMAKRIFHTKVRSQELFDISNFPDGIYFIQIDQLEWRKLIKD
ncbi:MAG TPA: T9SS type A sorting domain-containing protein [Bacteroidetes bacterium]|nr:T9SS type A sorting domain-containing protein [Bacteroidota bacterium]